jgi:hypothetical protein
MWFISFLNAEKDHFFAFLTHYEPGGTKTGININRMLSLK